VSFLIWTWPIHDGRLFGRQFNFFKTTINANYHILTLDMPVRGNYRKTTGGLRRTTATTAKSGFADVVDSGGHSCTFVKNVLRLGESRRFDPFQLHMPSEKFNYFIQSTYDHTHLHSFDSLLHPRNLYDSDIQSQPL
jgi:hypothetical protein